MEFMGLEQFKTVRDLPDGIISRELHAAAREISQGQGVNTVYAKILLPGYGEWMIMEKKGSLISGYPPGQDWRKSWQEVDLDFPVKVHAYLSGAPWGHSDW